VLKMSQENAAHALGCNPRKMGAALKADPIVCQATGKRVSAPAGLPAPAFRNNAATVSDDKAPMRFSGR
jgi:hypothetical protein